MRKLKIVIISRIVYPSLSPRSQRTTELAKEFARQGHNVSVYAVLGGYNYSSFESETGVKIYNIGKMLLGSSDSDGNHRYTLIDKVLYHTLHRLIEYPDIELMFRIPKIIRKEKNTDLLISIAYPHPIHWGAALAKAILSKNAFPKIWISDCGDPYMGDPINKKKFCYFKFIERWWSRNTDYITIPLEEGKDGYYQDFHSKIKVIPQGFNFSEVKVALPFVVNEVPTFAYAGSIYPGKRDPKSFLDFLITLNMDFRFIIYTNTPEYYDPYKTNLKDKLIIKHYVSRQQLIFELSKMSFLINFKNPSNIQLPSKLIDYLLTFRPIMDVSKDFSLKERDTFREFLCGNYINQLKGFDMEQFNIKNVAQKFIDLYNESRIVDWKELKLSQK